MTKLLNLVIILALVPIPLISGPESIKKDSPNFLILIADDAGMDFGCYGNSAIKTPHVDKLAKDGLIFESAFLTSPQCSPSRISILTGKYPHTTRTEDLHTPLPEGQMFVTAYLRDAGYFTGHTKKTHYGPNGNSQFDWYSQDLADFGSFIKKARNKPFFFWTGFSDSHRGYQAGTIAKPHDPGNVIVRKHLVNDEETRKDIAMYYDEISRMDSVIGTYIQILRDEKKLKNTYVIFLSDNGAPFPREKGTLYDAGIKTPLIFSGPEVPENEIYGGLASVIDLAPTIIELAGLDKPADMVGESMVEAVKGSFAFPREHVFSERNWHDCDEHMRSIRTDKYKLILNAYTERPHGTAADLAGSPSWFSLLQKKHTGELSPEQQLIFAVPRPRVELYDITSDPEEYNNLAFDQNYRGVARKLLDKLEIWMKETDDFPPTKRTRDDHTDRITGIRFSNKVPALENDLEEEATEEPKLQEKY